MATYTETPSGGVELSGTQGLGLASRDAFTDATGTLIASHAPDSGGSWALHPSYSGATVAIGAGNTVTMTGGSPGLAYHSASPSTPNYDVSCSVSYHITVLGANAFRGGVAGRINASENTFYRAKVGNQLYFDGDINWPGVVLEKVVAGTVTQLGSIAQYSGGRLTLRMSGSSISVLEGSTTKISATDSAITATGKAGVWFENNSSGLQWVRLDDFAADGPSQLWVDYKPPASGGLQASGQAATAFTFKPSASGGAQIGGQAIPAAGFSVIAASGGVQVSGQAAPQTAYSQAPQGGVQISGESLGGSRTFTEAAAGGIQLSGGATPLKVFTATPSGGVQLSGVGLLGKAFVEVARGGLQFSGSAAPQAVYAVDPLGGVEASGHAGPPDTWPYVMTGGVEISGEAVAYVAFNHPVAGGLQLSGSAAAGQTTYTVAASGGLQVGGHAVQSGLYYQIYANAGDGGPIDYDDPIAQTTALTWTSDVLAAPGVWKFAVRAARSGLEEKNLDAAVLIRLDGAGGDITSIPAAPTGLAAAPIAGGVIRVTWDHPSLGRGATGFRVYKGVGSPDYGTPAATVPAAARLGHYRVDLAGLADGSTYAIGVRAYNATGEEKNTTVVAATSDATGPDAVDGLTISTDPGDW